MARRLPLTLALVAYNKADSVQAAIRTATSGTIAPDLIVLADDGSDDGTPDLAEQEATKLGIEIRVFRSPRIRPYRLQSMRNICLEHAIPESVVVLSDSDCLFGRFAIETHLAIHETSQVVIGAGPRFEFLSGNAGPFTTRSASLECSYADAGAYVVPIGANMSFLRKTWEKVGGFDLEYEGHYGLDEFDFTLRAVALGASCRSDPGADVYHVPHDTIFGRRDVGRNLELFNRRHGGNHSEFEGKYLEEIAVPNYWERPRKAPLVAPGRNLDPVWGAPVGFVPGDELRLCSSIGPLKRILVSCTELDRPESLRTLRNYVLGLDLRRVWAKSRARGVLSEIWRALMTSRPDAAQLRAWLAHLEYGPGISPASR